MNSDWNGYLEGNATGGNIRITKLYLLKARVRKTDREL